MKNKLQSGYTIVELAFVVQFFIVLLMGISWVINLVQLLRCDFAAPWRDEIIHGIGVLIPPAALFTVWM